jgi:uncharacterized protein (TIGR03435 family)
MRHLFAVLLLVAAVVSISGQVPAPVQPEAGAPAFEVASVKVNRSEPNTMSFGMPPGRFTATNMPLRMLIMQAYQLSNYQLVGGPNWLDTDRFDIVAKTPDGAPPEQTRLMLRALLADRFKLVVHTETRDTPTYSLVLARSDGQLGPKLAKTTEDCQKIQAERVAAAKAARGGAASPGQPVPGPPMRDPSGRPVCTMSMSMATPAGGGMPVMTQRVSGQTMEQLTRMLSSTLSRQVIDRTGLTGLYDFELQYSMRAGTGVPAALLAGPGPSSSPSTTPTAPLDEGPSIFDAVRDLGLRLESERGSVEHLVIDRAERPSQD